MPITPQELERLQNAAGAALVEALLAHNISTADVQEIGNNVLDAIRRASGIDAPANELAPGRRVRSLRTDTPEQRGTVERTLKQDGEIHTVYVKWDGWTGHVPVSPRELEMIR